MYLSASVFLTALICNLQLVVVHADVEHYKHGKSLVQQERKVVLDDVAKLEYNDNTPAKVELNRLWKEEEDDGDDCSEGNKDWHDDDEGDGQHEHDDEDKHQHKSKHDDHTMARSKHCWVTSTDSADADSVTTVNFSTGPISPFITSTKDPLYSTSPSSSAVTSSATSSSASTTSSSTDEPSSTTESETTTTTNTDFPTPTIACTDDNEIFQVCVQEGVSPIWYWCAEGEWVIQSCNSNTVCRQGDDGGVYCDFAE